jgi:alpha-1,6-mannosyltransferase
MTGADGLNTADSKRGWSAEASLLIVSIMALVISAAYPKQVWGNAVMVVAASVCLGAVGWAWYRGSVSTAEVLVFAFAGRLLAFPLLPGLSDDGFRYVWDGWIQASGLNPYLYRPSDPFLADFQDYDLYSKLNSASYYSVYPPSSQLVFLLGGLGTKLGWEIGWYSIKAVFVSVEFIGIVLASRLVKAHLLLLYAWHPLVILEGAGQGHTEILMTGLLFVSLFAYMKERPGLSVAAVTVAGWTKLYPILFIPFLLRRIGWKYVWIVAFITVVLWIPYARLEVVEHIAASLELYVRAFEFNAGPYYLLKQLGYFFADKDLSKLLGPLLQNIFLIAFLIITTTQRKRTHPLPSVWLLVLSLLWITATTVHPWYLVAVLALIPFFLDRHDKASAYLVTAAWMWLSVASLATYFLYSAGELPYWIAVSVGWGGWMVLVMFAGLNTLIPALMRHRAQDKWHWMSAHLDHPERVLDLGAGEGFVGAEAAKSTNAEVILADVIDLNRTSLPFVRYNGRSLPFTDNYFDAVLLSYVLHHCDEPGVVLDEVRRVAADRVIVLESVIENHRDRRWLSFADRLANRLRSAGRMDESTLHFDTVAGWRRQFRDAGLTVVAEERRGRWFHKRHLFVLE